MNIEEALKSVRSGKHIYRPSWGIKNQYLFKMSGFMMNIHLSNMLPEPGLKCTDQTWVKRHNGYIEPYVFTQCDHSATDWEIVHN